MKNLAGKLLHVLGYRVSVNSNHGIPGTPATEAGAGNLGLLSPVDFFLKSVVKRVAEPTFLRLSIHFLMAR